MDRKDEAEEEEENEEEEEVVLMGTKKGKKKDELKKGTPLTTLQQMESTNQNKNRRGSSTEESGGQVGSANHNLLLDMNNRLIIMSSEMADIKKSLEAMSDNYDVILKEVKELREFKEKHINIGDQMRMLENKIHEMEQYSRNRNVEVKGVEELGRENLKEIAVSIASKCGVNMRQEDIEVAHRVDNRTGKEPRDIIIQFKTREVRDTLIQAKKTKINNTDITAGKLDKPIYVNEHLSAYYKRLFWETRSKCIERKYRYVWVKNGKILARKSENEHVIRIQSDEDLKKIK